METIFGETTEVDVQSSQEREVARNTMRKALQAHGQRGEVPVLAAKLKQTMLLMDPAFNEANFGYSQFKSWLEDNVDMIQLYVKDLQLYVAPDDYIAPGDLDLRPVEVELVSVSEDSRQPSTDEEYRRLFSRLKLNSADYATRRDVLRDIYRELSDRPGEITTDELLECLRERYETQDMIRSKPMLRDILQMAYRQNAFDYGRERASLHVPVWLIEGIESEADFVRRAEADFPYSVLRSGLNIDEELLAYLLLNDRDQVGYIDELMDDLLYRNMIVRKGKGFGLPGRDAVPCQGEPALKVVCQDIEHIKLPEGMDQSLNNARFLAKSAMLQRSQDFVAAASNYLLACRLMWDAVERNDTGATLQELRWYMASYASANAGKLSQVNRDYAAARPYYLAFFALVQEDDPLWDRMRGLINPMLSYYWANAGRALDINTASWNIGAASPAQIAVTVATHPNNDLRRAWWELTQALADVNPGLLRRLADQIYQGRGENPEGIQVADTIMSMLP